ncbi:MULTISPECIES: condensation domain-containing protein [unclassified Streptomyces]|uniref:condensation domain-containing protein n=1 Tax=unclassified Streptomyces TaxID=2593676 RepID=UPI0029AA6F96|nr:MULTISPECIES: condensation domain-containing protein [unclassified Streptomyces]MDX3767885.1 condensation domain-containing protein [Streptomyces sp. AK08-01B]MDX3818112.1 condensation domain-containing protein [Streptomyces sp. AK08-01A]
MTTFSPSIDPANGDTGTVGSARIASTLTDVWCAVLSVQAVQPFDNFFEIGGNSLSALRLLARLREHDVVLRLSDLLEAPQFGALLSRAQAAEPEECAQPGGSPQRLPLLPIQLRTLARDRVNPHHHNDDAIVGVPPGTSVSELVTAISLLVDHHPVLRSRFHLVEHEEWQETGHFPDVGDLVETVEIPNGDHEAVTRLGRTTHESLDLTRGKVAAFRILTQQSEPWALIAVVHHLVCDGMSWEILVSDLGRALTAVREGTRPVLTPHTDYATWARFLAEYAAGPDVLGQIPYWRERPWHLVADGLALKCRRSSQTLTEVQRVTSLVHIGDPPDASDATVSPLSEGLLLGALNYALHIVRGLEATLVDVVINGRDQIPDAPDVSRTVGWLAETTPVITHLGAAREVAEILQTTVAQLSEVPAPRLAFGCLAHLTPDRGIRAEFRSLRAADVYLNYRGAGRTDAGSDPLPHLPYSLGPAQCPQERPPYPLKVVCDLDGGDLVVQWRCSPDAFSRAEIDLLADSFAEAMRVGLLERPVV